VRRGEFEALLLRELVMHTDMEELRVKIGDEEGVRVEVTVGTGGEGVGVTLTEREPPGLDGVRGGLWVGVEDGV